MLSLYMLLLSLISTQQGCAVYIFGQWGCSWEVPWGVPLGQGVVEGWTQFGCLPPQPAPRLPLELGLVGLCDGGQPDEGWGVASFPGPWCRFCVEAWLPWLAVESLGRCRVWEGISWAMVAHLPN